MSFGAEGGVVCAKSHKLMRPVHVTALDGSTRERHGKKLRRRLGWQAAHVIVPSSWAVRLADVIPGSSSRSDGQVVAHARLQTPTIAIDVDAEPRMNEVAVFGE